MNHKIINLKEYTLKDDYIYHKEFFDQYFPIVRKNFDLNNKLVLDFGSGDGFHSGFLANEGCKYVIGIDNLDYDMEWWDGEKNFKQRLAKIFETCGSKVSLNKFQFIRMDAENLLFKDELFDLVFCVNVFEHVRDPEKALYEIWRVLKPNGGAFIMFDPVYYCDTGSHMFDYIPEPWGHLVCSNEDYAAKLKNAGTPPSQINDFLYGMNRKPKDYFINMFNSIVKDEYFEKLVYNTWSGLLSESHREHPNYYRLLNTNKYSEEDLLFRGLNILLRKKSKRFSSLRKPILTLFR